MMDLTISNETCHAIYVEQGSKAMEVHYLYYGDALVWSLGGIIDYSLEYFTIESLDNSNSIKFTSTGTNSGYSGTAVTFYTSSDKETWVARSFVQNYSYFTVNLSAGQKLYVRGSTSDNVGLGSNLGWWNISGTGRFKVSGNIMSLIYGNRFIGKTTINGGSRGNMGFANLFNGSTNLIDASNLVLPATSMPNDCYYQMFYGCNKMTTAPELPATTLTEYCYYRMFYGCSSLNYIKCLASSVDTNKHSTQYWTSGVADSGAFVKNPDCSTWPIGSDGVPSRWSVFDN